jgi:hypothetical protein
MSKGLLLAMMEPTAGIEQEFQDWYDHEHVPEREAVPGFETARRFVCLDGWPRYLALYDLDRVDVLKGEAYRSLIDRPAHPTRDKVLGRYRYSGRQVFPGAARLGDNGAGTRLVLLRFGAAPQSVETAILQGLRREFESRPGVCQTRLFHGMSKSGSDYVATVECHAITCEKHVDPAVFGAAAKHLDIENVYTPYWRVTLPAANRG